MSVASNASDAAVPHTLEHEDEYRKKLMLDPIPQGEMNKMVVDSLHRIDRTYLIVMGSVVAGHRRRLSRRLDLPASLGDGRRRDAPAGVLGLLHCDLCLLGRHQPFGNLCVGHLAGVQGRVSPAVSPGRPR